MSNTAPVPVWVGQLAPGPHSNVNIDGFGSWPPIAGAHGYNRLQASSISGKYNLAYEYKLTTVVNGTGTDVYGYGNLGYFNRGAVFSGWIIENTTIEPSRGGKIVVTIQWQSLAGYLPPDEWEVRREDLRPHIERHPLFRPLTTSDFQTVRLAYQASTISGAAVGVNQVQATTNPALAQKLLDKLLNGMEEYYMASASYVWSTYYLPGDVPGLSAGGVSYSNPGGPAGYILPSGNLWLREADEVGQANYGPLGATIKLTRHFIGAPGDYWDPDIYPSA